MNKQIDQLMVKAGAYFGAEGIDYSNFDPKKFTQLFVRECLAHSKLAQSQTVVNGSEEYNAGREMGIEVFINQIRKHFGVESTSIKVGSRVKVVSGFNVGAKGTVSYIEPTGRMWVMRDGASTDVFYHPEEVIGDD